MSMAHENLFQDVVRCHLCETPSPSLHCDVCHTHLCEDCEETHLLNESIEHIVVPFKLQGCITRCQKHSSGVCESYCEQCHTAVCKQCASSKEHSGHKFVDVVGKLESQREVLQYDLYDLEKFIYPKHQESASNIQVQRTALNENSRKLTTAIYKYREDLHREIDNAFKELKSEFDEINSKHLKILNERENKIKHTISKFTQIINELKELLNSNDVSIVSAYKSRNAKFRRLPSKLSVTLPIFMPQRINKEHICQQFGTLSALSITLEDGGYISPPDRPLIAEPRIITDINTFCGGLNGVSCLRDEQIWTCSYNDKIMRLYNLQGELMKSTQTETGNQPWDIAVTFSGDLVYTDRVDRTVNIVKNTHIQKVIEQLEWRPLGVCSSSSDDFLVVMFNDDKQTKVVRYSGSAEKQSIQYDDKGQPLYSCVDYVKYINENKNLDICVADYGAGAVVVVNQDGNFRFKYTVPPSTTKRPFRPRGITTDSQRRILTADFWNNRIHILDQNGQFLCYIDSCGLRVPCGLCVDIRDNLFVTEIFSGKVKEIQYCTLKKTI